MKFTTKKKLYIPKLKIWNLNEIIETDNIFIYSTPPKIDEKFSNIVFVILHNKKYHIVEAGCMSMACNKDILRKNAVGKFKLLHRNTFDELYTKDQNLSPYYMHKGEKKLFKTSTPYDKHNKYLNSLRHKMWLINAFMLKNPFQNVPSLKTLSNTIHQKAIEHFNTEMYQTYLKHRPKNFRYNWYGFGEEIRYAELYRYQQILNKHHLEECEKFEKVYENQKKLLKQNISHQKNKIKQILHLEKNDNQK